MEQTVAQVAHILQQHLLAPVPSVPGLHLDTAYVASDAAGEVGGDWYDVLDLGARGVVLTLGDVTGHDVDAAGRMGQVRAFLRAHACVSDASPAGLLRLLDRTIAHGGVDATATAVVARLDPPDALSRRLTWSSAGHLPPVLVRADGRAEALWTTPELVVGVRPRASRSDHRLLVGPGDHVVLYTDGLVERRGVPLLDGIDRLVEALAARSAVGPGPIGAAEVLALAGPDPDAGRDDAAVLVLGVGADVLVAPGRPAVLTR